MKKGKIRKTGRVCLCQLLLLVAVAVSGCGKDFDDLMEQFNSIVNKLISENDETKFKEYWQPRVVQITDKYLGRGQKVSQCSREQVEALSLIVDDLKELINK